jgi:hypothetical protein
MLSVQASPLSEGTFGTPQFTPSSWCIGIAVFNYLQEIAMLAVHTKFRDGCAKQEFSSAGEVPLHKVHPCTLRRLARRPIKLDKFHVHSTIRAARSGLGTGPAHLTAVEANIVIVHHAWFSRERIMGHYRIWQGRCATSTSQTTHTHCGTA